MLTAWWLPSTDQVKNRKFDNEFIKRELGIELFSGIAEKTTQLNRAIVGKPALIFTDSSVESMEALKEFPNRSVILFVLSDETYRFRFNFRIIANPKVKVIIRNYPYSQFLNLIFSIPFAFLKLIRLIKGRKLLGLLPKAILSGTYMLITQTSLKIMAIVARKSVLNLPIGYDSAFSRNYARHFGLGENDSLMQNAIPRYKYFENRKSIAKSKLIVFMKQ
jgi:hypothetical protein